jgi:lipoprotein
MKKPNVILLLTCILGLFSGSCADERTYMPYPDDTEGIMLMIPAISEFSTRADDNATAEELRCTSLTFFAFPQGGKGEKVVENLEQSAGQLTETPVYKGYNVQVKAGTYHFYVVANHAVPNISEITEEGLKEEILTYSGDYDGTIPQGGIPMSCLHTEMRVRDGSTPLSPLPEAGYEIKETEVSSGGVQGTGTGVRLYADLTFACSKITIRSAGGDGAAAPAISGIGVKKISSKSPLFGKVNGGFDYGKIDAVNIDAEGVEVSFYIPERYTATGTAQSEATFTIGDNEVTLPLGEDSELSEGEGPLEIPVGNRTLRRGYHYVYTLSPTAAKPVSLDVEPWTVEDLVYSIAGPFFLHLDKTVCPVTAGKESAIWFDTDAPGGITVESPEVTVGGKTLPLYTWRVNETGDSLKLRVNPAISSAYYNELNQEKEAYSHFHVKAGNLHKRVDVTPLTLDLYLNVTPQTLSIDVREQIASGNYSGAFPFIIDTNYPYFRIEKGAGWTGGDDGFTSELTEGSDYTLQLQDNDGNPARIGDNGLTSESEGLNTYRIAFGQLNSGKVTWKKNRALTLIVTAITDTGVPAMDADGKPISREVTINVLPSLQNYIIHFYAIGWSSPHIYAYQCLELPSDVDNKEHANKPIATNSEGGTAALEYSFTGKIAFKGWNVGDYNDPNAEVMNTGNGFYYFKDQTYSWNPLDASCSEHYYMDLDFCSEHRKKLKELNKEDNGYCGKCLPESQIYNKVWPGIQMEYEGGDWWRFELTGVAVPGKTLLMFNNGHTEGLRFPGTEQVGIPLFDFPNREGWLIYNGDEKDYAGNYFRSEKPLSFLFRNGDKVTIKWKDSSRKWVHLWSELGSDADDKAITVWPGKEATTVDGYNSVTVDVSYPSVSIGYILSDKGANQMKKGYLNNLTASSSEKIPTGTHYTFIL